MPQNVENKPLVYNLGSQNRAFGSHRFNGTYERYNIFYLGLEPFWMDLCSTNPGFYEEVDYVRDDRGRVSQCECSEP